MQYLRARYYNTKTGRFIQKDEYRGDFTQPGTLNRYAYCGGNPANRVDPSGHVVNVVAGVVGAVVGAVAGAATEVVPSLIKGEEVDWKRAGALAAGGAVVGAVSGLTFGAATAALAAGELSAVTIGVVSAETLITATLSSIGAVGLAGMAGSAVRQKIGTGSVDWQQVAADGLFASLMAGTTTYLYGATVPYPYSSVPSTTCTKATNSTREHAAAESNIIRSLGSKTEAYVVKRGWSLESMDDVVNNSFVTREAVNKANGNAATSYYNMAGDYVVVDDITGELVQLSKFGDVGWIPDSTIINPYRP